MEKFLSVSGFGDVSERDYESGIVLARQYFLDRNLDFYKCYKAYEKDESSELGSCTARGELSIVCLKYAG